MSWYRIVIATNRDDYLRSIGASEDIIQYISSLDENSAQLMTNEFRKRPQMTINEIQQVQMPKQYKAPDINKQLEDALMTKFPEIMQSWVLKQTRKMWRSSKLNDGFDQDYVSFVRMVYASVNRFGQKLSEITDFVTRSGMNIDISSYSYDQAVEASDEWHASVAGQGEGKIYEPTQQANILYGPTWIDNKTGKEIEEYKGWTIQNVTSKNDLSTEGNRMNHCVGDYCNDVERGDLSIASLRDADNEPHVTIELRGDGVVVDQIQGNSNHSPADEYKAMIKHWIQNSDDAPKYIGDEDYISRELDDIFGQYGSGHVSDIFSDLVNDGGEYGLSHHPWDYYEIEQAYNGIIQHLNKFDRGYGYSGDQGMGEDLVHAAINSMDEKHDGIKILTDLIQKTEEDANEYLYDVDIGIPYPQEEDFETSEEYDKAMEKYYEAQDEYTNDMMPFGFTRSLYKDIDSGLQEYKGMNLQEWWSHKQKQQKEQPVA